MTVKYGFYDSINGDRMYNANDINTFFEGVFSDGVFEFVGGALQVVNDPGQMSVLVKDGRAWFNNTWLRNTSTITLPIQPSSFIFDRKDLVILEFDSSITVRANSIKVLTGVPAAIPIPPVLANTSTLKQYALAEIFVPIGSSEITSGNITNTIGTVNTPYATSLISEPYTGPITTAINDFQLGDGSGNWIKKTLAQVITILRTALDGIYSRLAHGSDHEWTGSDPLSIRDSLMNAYPAIFKDWRDMVGSIESHTGSGTFTPGLLYATPSTGTTINSRCCAYTSSTVAMISYSVLLARFRIRINPSTPMTNSILWVGNLTNPTAPTATEHHAAFKIVNEAIYASCGNGTNGNLVDTGITLTQYSTRDFYIIETPTSLLYYVDGVLKVTFTTYRPNSGTLRGTFYMTTTNTVAKSIALFPMWLMQGN